MTPTIKIAIYTTTDDVGPDERFIGYFYWPQGQVANVVFRGDDPDALRAKITAFADAQLERADNLAAQRAEASQKRVAAMAAARAKKAAAE